MAIKSYGRWDDVQLSENIHLSELRCQGTTCGCKTVLVDTDLIEILQTIRTHYNKPLRICPDHSGYRCAAHNAAVGGSSGSYHTKGMAADISVDGVSPAELAKYAESLGALGIGLYSWGIHVDTRTSKSFWEGDTQKPRSTFGGAPAAAPDTDSAVADEYALQQFVADVQAALGTSAAGEALLAQTITVAIWKNRYHAVVAPIQRRLNAMEYDCGTVDGKVGPKFVAAVTKLQQAKKLSWCDGVITAKRETWRILLGL